jgi:hypothetical protein
VAGHPPPYEPRPIDPSRVKLTDDILELTELLARNAHDIWARRRLAEGWRYGPRRDDATLSHLPSPGLRKPSGSREPQRGGRI